MQCNLLKVFILNTFLRKIIVLEVKAESVVLGHLGNLTFLNLFSSLQVGDTICCGI